MDDIISKLEQLHITEKVPPPKTVGKSQLWKALCSLYVENKRLKQYIQVILEQRHDNNKIIPEWVF